MPKEKLTVGENDLTKRDTNKLNLIKKFASVHESGATAFPVYLENLQEHLELSHSNSPKTQNTQHIGQISSQLIKKPNASCLEAPFCFAPWDGTYLATAIQQWDSLRTHVLYGLSAPLIF